MLHVAQASAAKRLPRPELSPAEQKSFKTLLAQLEDEAQQILRDGKLTTAEPNAASRFDVALPPDALGVALLHTLSDDAFVDAYSRWQLLSYEPAFPELTDAQFIAFMRETPAMMENPWAEQRIVQMFERAEQAERLSAGDLAQMRTLQAELTQREDVAKHLNHPAEQFRRWVAEQIGETGAKPRLWLLEQCNATIAGGWSTRSIKMRISRNFSNSVADDTFTEAQRQMVARVGEQLSGFKRRYVSEVAVLADGSVEVRFSTALVTNSDVENWRNRLFDRVLK